ncbi:ABC transporter permease [Streptosporangium carneum]|uniref:ABC transporter permease n=1 Tax=Streptosporangium carneum TaxID=47481 RepID=UPI0022F2A7FE|nr:ABC transporter permease [Streptosporangium carneum]
MVAVLERHLLLYRRLWRASVFSAVVLPVLFLVSIGVGVGRHVGEVGGVGYLAWIAPGVMASTAFQVAVGESTYTVLGGFKWGRGYHAMRAAPVEVRDMVAGWLLYVLFRVEVAVVVFLGVTGAFGALRSPWAVAAPVVAALVALAAAAPVTAFAASIDHDSYFALLFRFVMIPSTLFAGVFFPVEQLPQVVRPLAYASPLWHGVELSRAATLGVAPPWPVWAHVGCLLVFFVAGVVWAVAAFGKRLQD